MLTVIEQLLVLLIQGFDVEISSEYLKTQHIFDWFCYFAYYWLLLLVFLKSHGTKHLNATYLQHRLHIKCQHSGTRLCCIAMQCDMQNISLEMSCSASA